MKTFSEGAHSMRLAMIALGLVFASVASIAWASGAYGNGTGPQAFERYVGLGSRLGTEALARDLNELHPPGTSLVLLLARLERAGFGCTPEAGRVQSYECSWRRAISHRRVSQIVAHIESRGMQVVAIEPRVDLYLR